MIQLKNGDWVDQSLITSVELLSTVATPGVRIYYNAPVSSQHRQKYKTVYGLVTWEEAENYRDSLCERINMSEDVESHGWQRDPDLNLQRLKKEEESK